MTIRFERDGDTACLLIDRAERRNAITLAMWQSIPHLLELIESEAGFKSVVLRSADDGLFSAGADIHELLANQNDAGWRAANREAIWQAQFRLARFNLPTIAFIDGDCVGGGCGLALACDIRVGSPNARFGITPAKLGLVYPFHDIKLLIDLVGPGQAKRLLYTGDLIDVSEARDIGLVEMIGSSADAVRRSIGKASRRSNSEMKRMIRLVLDGQADENSHTQKMFADAFESADFQEGIQAFVEKRVPKFGTE